MKTSNKSWWLLSGLVLMVTACGEEPTGPADVGLDLVPAFAKGGGGKPGGGGEPGRDVDIPLMVVFADGAEDGILSDGNVYEHGGTDFVSARIRTNGMFYFQTFAGKMRDTPSREVTVDLGSMAAELSHDDLVDFQAAVGVGWPVFNSDVTLHTRGANGGLYSMAVGSGLVDGGKIGFNDYGDGSAWEWRLLFDTRDLNRDGIDDGVASGPGLCVTRSTVLGRDTWDVSTDAGPRCADVDSITELWRVVGGVFTHVADFDTPMHLTLTGN